MTTASPGQPTADTDGRDPEVARLLRLRSLPSGGDSPQGPGAEGASHEGVGVQRPAADAPTGEDEIARRLAAAEGLPRDELVRHGILPIERRNGMRTVAVSKIEHAAAARALLRGAGIHPRITIASRTAIEDGLVEI